MVFSLSRTKLGYVVAFIGLFLAAAYACAEKPVRVATYNVKFLKASVSDESLPPLTRDTW